MSASGIIRVLIADGHHRVRESLKFAIATGEDMEMVGEAVDGHATIQLCESLKPDVLLIGLHLTNPGGLNTTSLISKLPHRPYIVMIDGLVGEQYERMAQEAGADQYLTLEAGLEDIIAAIRAARR